jgi:hypothetical protein
MDEFDVVDNLRQAEFDRRGTTDKIISYQSWGGHLMEWYEDEQRPGKPGRASAWAAWHSQKCRCGGEPLPDY